MEEPRYRRLACELAERIREGVYRPGERFPSLRKTIERHGVSLTTAQSAYALLESWRLIESRPRSGYYVRDTIAPPVEPSPEPMQPPVAVEIRHEAAEVLRRCQGEGVLDLGTAIPSAEFLPVERLRRAIGRVVRERMAEVVGMQFSAGMACLRRELAKRMADAGCAVSPEHIVVTNGAQEALLLSLRAMTRPGDTVAVESPTYVGLLQALESLGLHALEIPSHPREGVSLEALELALAQWEIRACAFMTANSNPSGASMPLERKRRLVEMLAERGIPLVEDDEFGDLAEAGRRAPAAKAFDQEGLVAYCASVSKSLASGLRVGWCVPGRFQEEVMFMKSFSSVSTPALCQMAVAEMMADGSYDRHLRQVHIRYAAQVQRFSAAIARHFPRGTTVSRPSGGYVLWVGLPEGSDAAVLYRLALHEGVGIMPGHLFSAAGRYRNYLRLNCAVPWSERVEHAVMTLGRLAASAEVVSR